MAWLHRDVFCYVVVNRVQFLSKGFFAVVFHRADDVVRLMVKNPSYVSWELCVFPSNGILYSIHYITSYGMPYFGGVPKSSRVALGCSC